MTTPAFTIPNQADAEHITQAMPDARDFHDMLALQGQLHGVISGCAVTAQGSPDMTLAVASGEISYFGKGANVSAGNVTVTSADGTYARFDLVCVDSDGSKSVVAGTPGTNPVFPDPSGKVVLAAVRVPASATSINNNKIVDKRIFINLLPGTYNESNYTLLDTPMANLATSLTSIFADTLYWQPVFVYRPATITAMSIQVTTAQASSHARLGLYMVNHSGDPTSLIVDAGALDTSTTGVKTASLSPNITLAPGRYYAGVVYTTDSIVVRTTPALGAIMGVASGANWLMNTMTSSFAYGALSDPAPGLTSSSFGTLSFACHVLFSTSTY